MTTETHCLLRQSVDAALWQLRQIHEILTDELDELGGYGGIVETDSDSVEKTIEMLVTIQRSVIDNDYKPKAKTKTSHDKTATTYRYW